MHICTNLSACQKTTWCHYLSTLPSRLRTNLSGSHCECKIRSILAFIRSCGISCLHLVVRCVIWLCVSDLMMLSTSISCVVFLESSLEYVFVKKHLYTIELDNCILRRKASYNMIAIRLQTESTWMLKLTFAPIRYNCGQRGLLTHFNQTWPHLKSWSAHDMIWPLYWPLIGAHRAANRMSGTRQL